jgi:hypothetical protein
LRESARTGALIRKILSPEGIAQLDKTMEIATRFDALEERVEKEEQLAEKFAELNANRWDKYENDIKEKISLWLADVNEPIWVQIHCLQERMTKLETLVKGHP